MSREGSRSFQWLVLALVLLHILPIWLFEYIPTQDGPCHLETAYTFSHYSDAGSEYSRYYVRNIAPVPSALIAHMAFSTLAPSLTRWPVSRSVKG